MGLEVTFLNLGSAIYQNLPAKIAPSVITLKVFPLISDTVHSYLRSLLLFNIVSKVLFSLFF